MRRRESREHGAALVEFALIVPLLSMFLFGIVQFGIAYDKQQSINSAAREGARLAALESSTLSDIATRAVESYDASAAPGEDPTVTVYDDAGNVHGTRSPDGTYSVDSTDETLMPCGEASPGSNFVRVVVSTPYEITIPFLSVQNITIDSEAEFRCE